jgi:rhamnosyltransferase
MSSQYDSFTVGLVIPTLNAGSKWKACIDAIKGQSLGIRRILVIDSQSTDRTASIAREATFDVIGIERSDFNHGGTRQWAAEYLNDCEIVVFLTQDAVFADPNAVGEICKPFADPEVAMVYGRHIPHDGASPIEAHSRVYNYDEISRKKSAASVGTLGAKVFFSSNSFAAYRRSVLLELGGFKQDLILGEDMEFAARAIKAGYANFYAAQAVVHHSHDYSLRESFVRYFDLGAFAAENDWMRRAFGSHQGEGLRFVKSELRYLWEHAPRQIPMALLQTCAKLLGYRTGRFHRYLPVWLKRRLSMQPGYWK